jgi:hypothetical protein
LAVRHDSYVSLKGGGAPFCSGDAGHNFIRPFFVFAIADRDIGAILRQAFRDRASDSLIATRYGNDFSCQSIWQDPSQRFLLRRKEPRPNSFFDYLNPQATVTSGLK